MIKIRVDYFDLVEAAINDTSTIEEFLCSKGFDLSKPFTQFDDFEKRQIVFLQESQEKHSV